MVRVKHRYILCEIVTETHRHFAKLPFVEKTLKEAIIDSVEELHGDFGLASILPGFAVKMFNRSTRMFILRVHRKFQSVLSTSLPIITSVENVKLAIKTLHLSGTIRCAYKFLVNYDKEKLCELRQNYEFSAEDQVLLSSIIEMSQRRMGKKPQL
ncbi:hypothetical protein TNIN_5891 [Trichonephila inaurata madagascariensis]|uniref:Ribonuclease P/MRP protein subunit POP5 n=1 Tax=Trichonephila inaurata madagascariensis TaxID=2747483 RepID=A0A8X6IY59_9ARAC|nr:hypothetical protein TNIN_5891 [Trichonephila inaurata madagascariensis]